MQSHLKMTEQCSNPVIQGAWQHCITPRSTSDAYFVPSCVNQRPDFDQITAKCFSGQSCFQWYLNSKLSPYWESWSAGSHRSGIWTSCWEATTWSGWADRGEQVWTAGEGTELHWSPKSSETGDHHCQTQLKSNVCAVFNQSPAGNMFCVIIKTTIVQVRWQLYTHVVEQTFLFIMPC